GQDFGTYGRYAAGPQYFNYGSIPYTAATGADLGTFTPSEFMFLVSTCHTANHFSMGASLKFAGSQIETYNASALMADFGGVFKHPDKEFTIGLVVKNAGFALKKFTPETPVSMPFDIQVGTTYKPEHMPLR